MLIKISPRWMVNSAQVRAIGKYPDSEKHISVEYIDGSETSFMCDSPEERDRFLAEIEEIYCPKKLFNSIEED